MSTAPHRSAHYGRLIEDLDEGKIQCGLCGRWYRALPTHLRYAHDLDADQYRRLFGLRAQRALVATEVSDAMRASFERRLQDRDLALLEGMARGHELARCGELAREGSAMLRELPLEGERLASRTSRGRALGRRRAERARGARDARARDLGSPSLEQHLRDRYLTDGARVAEIAAELHVAEITVIGDMERLGIARRPQDERLALGREALARERAARRAQIEARAHELPFEGLGDYLTDRVRERRWRQRDVAAELGVPVGRLRKLMREQEIAPARRAAPASTRDRDAYQRKRVAAAQRALAVKRGARDDAIAARLGYADVDAWYASRRAAGATARELMAEAGMGEKWLRRLAREWRVRPD